MTAQKKDLSFSVNTYRYNQNQLQTHFKTCARNKFFTATDVQNPSPDDWTVPVKELNSEWISLPLKIVTQMQRQKLNSKNAYLTSLT